MGIWHLHGVVKVLSCPASSPKQALLLAMLESDKRHASMYRFRRALAVIELFDGCCNAVPCYYQPISHDHTMQC